MERCLRVGLSLSVAIFFAVVSTSFAEERWSIEDVGYVGYETRIADMNDAGVVVGRLVVSGKPHAFVMEKGVITDLGTNGGAWSEAVAVNKSGQVTGNYADPFPKAFFWDKGGMIDLGTLGGQSATATAINDSGEVVGYSQTDQGHTHAFLWKKGVMTDLGTLGGNESMATCINNAGEIAGLSTTAADSSLFDVFRVTRRGMQDLGESPLASIGFDYEWSRVTSMNKRGEIAAEAGMYPHSYVYLREDWTSTADPGAPHHFYLSFAEVINDKGVFAGTYFDIEGNMLGFVWKDGKTTYIPNPDKEYAVSPDYVIKDDSNSISDMNNKGEVVGSSFNLYGPGPHAFVWHKGVTTLLPTLYGEESRAFAINKKGKIAGINGDHMVVWTKR